MAPLPFSISQVTGMTGIPECNLRIWEKRYHWPRPDRRPNGYRLYSPALTADIIRMAALLRTGANIGDILRDGEPRWPVALAAKPRSRDYDFASIATPATPEGQQVRARLEAAIRQGDGGMIAWAKAQLPLLHPLDRGRAVLEVVRLAGV